MPHPFDSLSAKDLRKKTCTKWQRHPEEVLPLWVADMDFPVAEAIKQALLDYVPGDDFGYAQACGLPGLKEALQERLARFGWRVEAEHLEPLSGIICGLHLATVVCAGPSEEVVVQSPIYPPFLSTIKDNGRVILYNELVETPRGWEIDFEALEGLVTPMTRLLMFCNPHNPTGRVFRRDELERLADLVLKHRLWVVSDELHSDLVYSYSGHEHIPFASLDSEIAVRTVTLLGPTKTFNIAGLKIGFMIAQNETLLKALKRQAGHLFTPNVMAQAATIAAYRQGDGWLEETLGYLRTNRDFIARFLLEELPRVSYFPPEGTYLAWLDFRGLGLEGDLYRFLLEDARVALNDGPLYGPGGEGFARLNFATSRVILEEALIRIRDACKMRLG
jgi:cysteine-S-conjugate beta-lyase